MATVLEDYQEKKKEYLEQIAKGSFQRDDIFRFQETNYRIEVLECFQFFCRTAPITTDEHEMAYHYGMVCIYIDVLVKERRYGKKADDELRIKRDTAFNTLMAVYEKCKEIFRNYQVESENYYRECISRFCSCILPVWLQYRDTYISLA